VPGDERAPADDAHGCEGEEYPRRRDHRRREGEPEGAEAFFDERHAASVDEPPARVSRAEAGGIAFSDAFPPEVVSGANA
jgi:hypothetical protein